MSEENGLPTGWATAPLSESVLLNPPRMTLQAATATEVNFIPMSAVREEFGGIDISGTRPLVEVQKGYTQFADGDVLFAKITPCMENGKIAVIPILDHGVGYGSTEFHVLRAPPGIEAGWIARYLSRHTLRREARRSMTGSAGQLRVPARWLGEQVVPLAPSQEQHRIVARIEELFSSLDAGVAALERAKVNLKRYRAAVLKAAVEGKLTAEWRAKHPNTEPASKLLERILSDRRNKWEADQFAKFTAAGKEPPERWKAKYVEPIPPDTSGLRALPEGWCWTTTGYICDCIVPNRDKPKSFSGDIPWITLPDFDNRIELATSNDGIGLTPDEAKTYRARIIPAGSVVMSCIGRFGLSAVLLRDAVINQQLHAFVIPKPLAARYLAYAIRTQEAHMNRVATATTISYMNKDKCNSVPIPLPSFSEQDEIVRIIEEKLSVSDVAERQIEANLLRAARLRQSILKQAFEGKLVPQDPNDEPASALLERIKANGHAVVGNGRPAVSRRKRSKQEAK